MKRFRLACSLWLPLVLVAMPVAAQTARPASPPQPGPPSGAAREPSKLQMTIMEEAFQLALEDAQGRALAALQMNAGMPAIFTMEGNTRARAFRISGYGVFFDVDLPPIPRSVEWGLRILDTGPLLVGDLDQLQRQLTQLNDARVSRALDPIIRSMRTKVGTSPRGESAVKPELVGTGRSESADPFTAYVGEVKKSLIHIILEYGPVLQMGPDDWLHVAAREISPKLLPGNPTDATITIRIKASDLAALKASRITRDEAARRIEVTEVY